jgi:hypothetical protein
MFNKPTDRFLTDPSKVRQDLMHSLEEVSAHFRTFGEESSTAFQGSEKTAATMAKLLRRSDLGLASEVAKHVKGKISYIGGGYEKSVFDIGGGYVAKIGIRTREQTLRKMPEVLGAKLSKSFGNVHLEISPKAFTGGATLEMAKDLQKKLAKRGYIWNDAIARNVGISNNRPVVIDTGNLFKSRAYTELRDYGMRKGAEPHMIARMARQRSRNVEALSPEAAGEIKRMIDVAHKNKMDLMRESVTALKTSMEAGETKAAAGMVAKTAARIMRSL